MRSTAVVTRLVLVGVAAVIAALLAAGAAGPARAGGTARESGTAGPASLDRTPRDARIVEASGLVTSRLHPGVVWTHNDSGNPPNLYAVSPDGTEAATLRLTGTTNHDWEALASYRDAKGRAMLAVGDIGDNAASRATVEIDILPEPRRLVNAKLRPERIIKLSYPDGPTDAETLLIDPRTDTMYVVSKGLGSMIYVVPREVFPGVAGKAPVNTGTMTSVASTSLILVTDGLIEPDGRLLLRTYSQLVLLPPIEKTVDGALNPLATVAMSVQRQGEGLALRDGKTALLASEGVREPILRATLPAAFQTTLPLDVVPGALPTPERATAAESARPVTPSLPAITPLSQASRPQTGLAKVAKPAVLGLFALTVVGIVIAFWIDRWRQRHRLRRIGRRSS